MVSVRLVNRLISRSLIGISILLVFFNEVCIYYLNQAWWKDLECKSSNCTRILLIADPQLLGSESDKSYYSGIAQSDADRFVRKTFERAIQFTDPDIICFLGDLLDEGNTASPYQYRNYVKRFHQIFHTSTNKARRIHVPGDNDIGGENGEYISNSNIRRFEIEFMHEDLFDYENRIRFFKINRMLFDFTNPDRGNNFNRIRIGVTHMPLLMSGGSLMRNVINDLDPHLIFSAHWHESRIFLYPSTRSQELYSDKILQFDLENLKNNHQYLEIMVPTSSYRMGKNKIGYGYATIDNNLLQYTVLWNFSRFISLKLYISWIVFMFVVIIMLNVFIRCPIKLGKRKKYERISYIPPF